MEIPLRETGLGAKDFGHPDGNLNPGNCAGNARGETEPEVGSGQLGYNLLDSARSYFPEDLSFCVRAQQYVNAGHVSGVISLPIPSL